MKYLKQLNEEEIYEAYGKPYAEGDLENIAFMQVNRDRVIMSENLSTRDKEWEEKIGKYKHSYRDSWGDHTVYCITEEQWKVILSEMEAHKNLRLDTPP